MKQKNTSILQIDSPFVEQYRGLLETQRLINSQLATYPFDLEKNEITNAIIQRMDAFWYFNVNNCNDLGRKINTVSSDFFTESCLLFIKALANQRGIQVFSERNISGRNQKTNMRPDLSFWKNDELVAVIELKVSDGYKGKHMVQHLEDRKNNIRGIWPEAFFGAIVFWNCFQNYTEIDSNYIGLLNFSKHNNHEATGKTIEQLLKRLFDV